MLILLVVFAWYLDMFRHSVFLGEDSPGVVLSMQYSGLDDVEVKKYLKGTFCGHHNGACKRILKDIGIAGEA